MWIKRNDLLAIGMLSVPFLYWTITYDSLTDKIPVHWNYQGHPDAWETRDSVVKFFLFTSAIALLVYLLMRSLSHIDPKKTAKVSQRTFDKVALGVVMFMASLNFMTLYSGSHNLNSSTVMFFLISILFAFLGNVMYNIKPNYFVGIRLPWTLEDDENWKLTHRLAGIVWFAGGLISAILTLVLPSDAMSIIFMIIVMIIVIIPTAYSFYLFKKSKSQHT